MSHHYSACEAGCCEDVERLTRERDAARADVERLREMVAALEAGWPDTLVAGSELDAAEFERDEALAEVVRWQRATNDCMAQVASADDECVSLRALLRRCEPIIAAHEAVAPPGDTLLAEIRAALEER